MSEHCFFSAKMNLQKDVQTNAVRRADANRDICFIADQV
jgi:hypothetical protein